MSFSGKNSEIVLVSDNGTGVLSMLKTIHPIPLKGDDRHILKGSIN